MKQARQGQKLTDVRTRRQFILVKLGKGDSASLHFENKGEEVSLPIGSELRSDGMRFGLERDSLNNWGAIA